MSSASIVDKLTTHIERGLREESDVTYLLIQVGKLLERDGVSANYPAVSFFRNWIAHPTLGRVNSNPEMRVILNKFNTLVDAFQRAEKGAARKGTAPPTMETMGRAVIDSISLTTLERELNGVIARYRVDAVRVGRAENWGFRPLLLRIVAEIALQSTEFAHIRRIYVRDDGRFDTVVLTDRAGRDHNLPLT